MTPPGALELLPELLERRLGYAEPDPRVRRLPHGVGEPHLARPAAYEVLAPAHLFGEDLQHAGVPVDDVAIAQVALVLGREGLRLVSTPILTRRSWTDWPHMPSSSAAFQTLPFLAYASATCSSVAFRARGRSGRLGEFVTFRRVCARFSLSSQAALGKVRSSGHSRASVAAGARLAFCSPSDFGPTRRGTCLGSMPMSMPPVPVMGSEMWDPVGRWCRPKVTPAK